MIQRVPKRGYNEAMPEVITKYPETVVQVLRGPGAKCGPGQEQKILKACPPERFCSLPSGELCVYGIQEIRMMTQVTPEEVSRAAAGDGVAVSTEAVILIALALGLGFLGGLFLGKRGRGSGSP